MAGIGDHIHVKKNTAGSSNELSFDVLDAARNGLDTKGRKAPRPQALQKPSKGDYHGVAERRLSRSRQKPRRGRPKVAAAYCPWCWQSSPGFSSSGA